MTERVPYRIERLELHDFLSHRRTVIAPGDGVTALLGENGAGKSSIVDALYILLTLPQKPGDVRGVPRKELVRRGATTAVLQAFLEDPTSGSSIRIRAELPGSDRGQARYTVWVNGAPAASGYHASRKTLEKILAPRGLNIERFIELAGVIRQGRLSTLITMLSQTGARERVRYFERMLGLEDYSRAAELLKEKAVIEPRAGLRSRRYSALARQLRYRPVDRDLRDLNHLISQLAMERRTIAREIGRLREEIAELERLENEYAGRAARLEEEESRLHGEIGRLKALASRVSRLEAEESRLRKLILELEKRLREIDDTLQMEARAETLVELDEQVLRPLREKQVQAEKIQLERERLSETLEALKRMETLKETVVEEKRLQETLDRLEEERARYTRDLAVVRERMDAHKRLQAQAEAIILHYRLSPGAPEEVLDKTRKALELIRAEIHGLEEEREKLVAEEAGLGKRIEELENRLHLLEEADEPRCPVCRRRLDAETRERLLEEIRSQLREARRRREVLGSLISEKERLLEEKKRERDRLAEAEARLAQILDSMKGETMPSPEEIRLLESGVQEIEARIREARERLARIRGDLGVYRELERRYGGLDRVEVEERLVRADEALRRLREEISGLRDRLRDAASKLDLPADEQLLAAKAAEARRLLDDMRRFREERIQLQARLKEMKVSLERIDEEKRQLERETSRLPALMERLADVQDELEETRKKLDETRKKLAESRARLEEVRAEYEDAVTLMEELKRLRGKLALLHRVRKALEEAPRVILEETMRRLEEEMSGILEEFALAYTSAEIDRATLEVRVLPATGATGPVRLSQLSGGEQTAVALAYLLAFRRVLGSTLDFLVLDEPTTHLDAERRRTLMEILRKAGAEPVAGLGQLLVVTHHEEVRDAASQVCLVSKEDGVSRVECEGVEV